MYKVVKMSFEEEDFDKLGSDEKEKQTRLRQVIREGMKGMAEELKKLQAELAALEKSAPEAPSAMGATERTVVDVPILRRGPHAHVR